MRRLAQGDEENFPRSTGLWQSNRDWISGLSLPPEPLQLPRPRSVSCEVLCKQAGQSFGKAWTTGPIWLLFLSLSILHLWELHWIRLFRSSVAAQSPAWGAYCLSSVVVCKQSQHFISSNVSFHGKRKKNSVLSMGLVHAQCSQSTFLSSHVSLSFASPSHLLSSNSHHVFRGSLLLCSCQHCAAYEPFSITQTGFGYTTPFFHFQEKTYHLYNRSWSKLLCTTKSLIIYFLLEYQVALLTSPPSYLRV